MKISHNANRSNGGLVLKFSHLNGSNYDSSLGPQMWDHVGMVLY